ncbi:MAG: hypothetical protein ACI80P_000008 [Flavobacteriales bacterium]|jgi:hypothetical protein
MRAALLLLLFASPLISNAGVFVYNGVYQGKDLYVKNPFAGDGVGFCVFEVKVNGEVTSDEINSSAFAIDLELYKLKIGTPIEITIRTKEDCEPNIINIDAIAPASTYSLDEIALVGNQTLTWKTSKESSNIPFVVEQFKWNKWVDVAEVVGEGKSKGNVYTTEISTHNGENTFRLRQDDAMGSHYSDRYVVQVTTPEINIITDKIFEKIEFSSKTDFEVFDEYGIVVAQGRGASLDCAKWTPGSYYINYGGKFGQKVRKR